MACSCKGRQNTKYEWTDGENVVKYDSEMAAKAKVIRKGGSYKPVTVAPTA